MYVILSTVEISMREDIRYYFNPHIRKEVNDEYTHQKSKH